MHLALPAPAALRRRTLVAALPSVGWMLSSVHSRPARAQPTVRPDAWPERRVRLIVPAPPGSSLDLVSRAVAEQLAARWGQPVVVEGRPGADGIPALEAMLAAPPGDALMLANHGVVTVTLLLHPRLGFDPMAELAPVVDLTADPFAVAVPAALPVSDLAGLVAYARERPGVLNYTAPPGPPYLAIRAFLRDTGIDMAFVAFRGVGAAAVAELAAGRLHAMLAPLASLGGAARGGQLRVLAVTGAERAPALPTVPTTTELGFAGFRQEGIHGLFGWKAMPEPLRRRVAVEAAAVVAEPALAERLGNAGVKLRGGGTPERFAALLVEQRDRWTALAREFGAMPPS
jgi:tripartite-type tricarboxylate transporter receptor subunit TctC